MSLAGVLSMIVDNWSLGLECTAATTTDAGSPEPASPVGNGLQAVFSSVMRGPNNKPVTWSLALAALPPYAVKDQSVADRIRRAPCRHSSHEQLSCQSRQHTMHRHGRWFSCLECLCAA